MDSALKLGIIYDDTSELAGFLLLMEQQLASDRVLGIFKFGKLKHIEEFVNEGHLYMNPLSYFRNREAQGDALRYDKHEGAAHCEQATGGKLQMMQDDQWITMGTIQGPIISSDNSKDTTKVFCMYALRDSSCGVVDTLNFEFGDTYAVMINGDAFLDRVKKTTKRQRLIITWGLVEYVDRESYSGPMGCFRKFSDFEYQSEFRIAIESETKEPFSLYVGDLSEMAKIGPLNELNKRIRLTKKER